MDNNYGVEIPIQVSEALRCGLCHFCQDEKDRGLVCTHPQGAAIERHPPLMRINAISCKNWQEDYPLIYRGVDPEAEDEGKIHIPLTSDN